MDATASFKLWKRGQKLGEGTFGEVYVATHEKTGEVAAIAGKKRRIAVNYFKKSDMETLFPQLFQILWQQ